MNTNDLLLRWSQMSLDQIEEEIRSGKDADSVEQLLGTEAMLQVQDLAFSLPDTDLEEAVVLLPGVMGSLLSSIRGVTTQVWINPLLFVEGKARYLRLAEDGQNEACPEVEMAAVGLERMTYLKMSLALNRKAELFEFPYDWRRPIAENARVLCNCLERWAAGTQRKFTLLAHSMGGLVSRSYMAQFPALAEQRVKRLIMMGTPNFGATNAIETLFTGNALMATVNGLNKRNDMVDVVRSLPGVYNLLPAPPALLPAGRPYPVSWNLYDAASWRIDGIRQAHLDSARRLHESLAAADPQIQHVMIAGCNQETLVGLKVDFTRLEMPRLVLDRIHDGDNSGDGTVPLWSALLPRAEVYYVRAKHSDLPNQPEVIDAALNLILGDSCTLPTALPEPRSFLGLHFGLDGEEESAAPEELAAPSPAELEEKIRSGTADQNDLKSLRFAL